MKTYLDIEETELLENAAIHMRDRLLIRILRRLGCRITEALGLTTEDVSFEQGTVTILHLKTRLKLTCPQCNARLGRGHIFCPKCGITVEKMVSRAEEHRRVRTLPIDDDTLGMLRDYINRGGNSFRNGNKFIFGINRHRAWQIVRGCAQRAGLPNLVNPETGRSRGVSPHRLRDAFAVHAVKTNDTGDALRLLQEHLGHSSFNTTAKYRKVAGDELKEWYEKLWRTTGS